MKIIGLTGGTGSGQSTVAKLFIEHGFPVIDADRVGHELIAPGGAAEAAVIEAFGEDILSSGIIDRAKLGAIVFGAPDRLARLNALVHPRLFGEIARQCQEHAARGAIAVIVDAALLGESGAKDAWIDDLILVTAPAEVRAQRLEMYRGIPRAEAERRIAAQSDPERKRAFARWVIDNAGTLEALRPQVADLVEQIRAEADRT